MRIRHNACKFCGGDLHQLGTLGNLQWFRCRHCGGQFSRTLKSVWKDKKDKAVFED